MLVFGIETSCDETAAALVRDGRQVLSSVVRSQVDEHRPHGGVVPELAARAHLEVLPLVMQQALREAEVGWSDVDVVAATRGPGLAGALLIGFHAARALAMRLGRPFVPVHHLEAHLYAIFLAPEAPGPEQVLPAVGLLVSGGHSSLLEVNSLRSMRVIGCTLDDAAGEALDKGACLLGLGYPGGALIERMARSGRADFAGFPRARIGRTPDGRMDPACCFSFSGVKTALKYYVEDHPAVFEDGTLPDVAASYQEAIFEALDDRFAHALRQYPGRPALAGGGVLCNAVLRARLEATARRHGRRLYLSPAVHCADNAAMVAGLAAHLAPAPSAVAMTDIDPRWPVGAPI